MKKEEAILTLQRHQSELKRRGVAHAALFGFVSQAITTPLKIPRSPSFRPSRQQAARAGIQK